MNSVRVIEGVTVAYVGWLPKPWRVIEVGETFDQACDRSFVPIAEYRTSDELFEAAFKN